jgi:SpoVK/Ycf46/Vps4 family AAA+-type ATPase
MSILDGHGRRRTPFAGDFSLENETTTEIQKTKIIPLQLYSLKDMAVQLAGNKNFQDAILTSFALVSIAIAFPFLPVYLLIPLAVCVFALALVHPLLGLMSLLFSALPMLLYQVPLLMWIFTIIVSISLILGYKYYRAITYAYALAFLSLSSLGLLFVVPGFVIAVLVVGFRRGAAIAAVVIAMCVMTSGLTGLPLYGPIAYNQTTVHTALEAQSFSSFLTPSKPAATLFNILPSVSSSLADLFGPIALNHLYNTFYFAIFSIVNEFPFSFLQVCIWLCAAFVISSYAIKSRSTFRGTLASLFGVLLPLSYFAFTKLEGIGFSIIVVISFLITPVFIFLLELEKVDVVQALDVMKQDTLSKFGVAFEDLTKGSKETFDDVADYVETKKELRNSVLAPIEHREIAGAYGVRPAKGILLFGPPGTGKTLIMRAMANEIRASFYYVNGASLLSGIPGSSSQAVSRIFATAKKNAPCVLFFDEIDSIASRRDSAENDSKKELLTAMLSEMDGFEKMSNVVIVGATNVPQLLDPSIMRPGRFDKILFMPLPDQRGRSEIFRYYLSNLPVGKNIDYDQLASLSTRFSGADIKNICDEVGRKVGEKAIEKHEMLIIRMQDILAVLKSVKPSTSLSQLEEYNTFKLDYERRTNPEVQSELEEKVMISDVVGLEEAKKALHEAVEIPILHPDLIKKYDIGGIKGILLFGPPGTGKTLLMTAVANELGGVSVITMSGYDLSKNGVTKASVSIKELFNRAKEHTPAIVFVDEIDALVPTRDTSTEAGGQLTGEFLQEFDKIKEAPGIVVVAATNRPDVLDPALLRPGRFDRLIYVPPPEKADRETLFNLNLEKVPLSEDMDTAKLAEMTEGFTGADIVNLCRQAKINALETSLSNGAEVKIQMGDIVKLIQKTRPSAPNAIMGRYLAFFSKYGKR